MMTGMSRVTVSALSRSRTASPSRSGIMTSSRTRSTGSCATSGQRLVPARGGDDGVALTLEPALKELAVALLVVHH